MFNVEQTNGPNQIKRRRSGLSEPCFRGHYDVWDYWIPVSGVAAATPLGDCCNIVYGVATIPWVRPHRPGLPKHRFWRRYNKWLRKSFLQLLQHHCLGLLGIVSGVDTTFGTAGSPFLESPFWDCCSIVSRVTTISWLRHHRPGLPEHLFWCRLQHIRCGLLEGRCCCRSNIIVWDCRDIISGVNPTFETAGPLFLGSLQRHRSGTATTSFLRSVQYHGCDIIVRDCRNITSGVVAKRTR